MMENANSENVTNATLTDQQQAFGTAEMMNAASMPEAEMQNTAFQSLMATPLSSEKERKLDLLYDLNLPVSIELGRTNMLIKEILDLQRGSIIEFEKLASEPVDILINGKKMAEGEVVIIEKHFGIRITNLIQTSDRVKGLGK
jgi:flagellar motor switch protein FliN